MNEFIEQFLIEARELIEQATGDLLALEEHPQDQERLNSAFRAFHTLKGSAGIVDFDAMGRALHVAENVLSALRSGERPVTAALVSDCLTCLDQVVQWLDQMEVLGEAPADADAAADVVIARFEQPDSPAPRAQGGDWVARLIAQNPGASSSALAAVRLCPQADSFFRGLDPLAMVQALPGLVAVSLEPTVPWPSLDAFDPSESQLTIFALSSAPTNEIAAWAQAIGAEVQSLQQAVGNLPSAASALIEAQIKLLGERADDGLAGRVQSAKRTAANVLESVGQAADAHALTQLGDEPDRLVALLHRLMGEGGDEVVGPVAEPIGGAEVAARVVRVDVERIDALVRLTGELTVVKNALGHVSALALEGGDAKTLAASLKEQHSLLGRLIADLQRSVLGIRVLPMRHVFQRFPRTVRELGAGLKKPVRLVIEGDDTEADKAVVEGLFEPLMHLVRNALDHGIEPQQLRAAAGKQEIATLILRAVRRGEQVVVELQDDGKGIDVARVREVAAARGIISPEVLASLSDQDAADLIFAPGFSTAAAVSDLSGRGVGMDAVRRAIERLGGRVSLESSFGLGTLVRLTLPFTVMMSQVLTVETSGQVFGVPLDAVVETVRVAGDQIVPVGLAHAFVFRDRTIPLVVLAEMLQIGQRGPAGTTNVLVVQAAGQLIGIEVDRIGERMEVMLKPMEGLLAGAPSIAGTTLMGDGRVLIVLDLLELTQ